MPSGTVYLKPYITAEYNAQEYARLQNPQDLQATANRWTWVQISPLSDVTLTLRGGGAERPAALDGFSIVQIPGPALGYAVVPFQRGPASRRRAAGPSGAPTSSRSRSTRSRAAGSRCV